MTQLQNPPPLSTQLCARCGQPLASGDLACRACGQLVHVDRLMALSAQAQQTEAINPTQAAAIWAQCLQLLPPDSPQYAMVWQRIYMLAGGGSHAEVVQPDPWPIAVLKTGGSMIVTILVYGFLFYSDQGLSYSFGFAAGFVVLMLIHEMGHVVAMRHYGIPGSPPIFIPLMGALINLRRNPENAKEEAIIGIGGPVLGTIGAIACYGLAMALGKSHPLGSQLLLEVASWGFFLNLFNLLPVPPLDGGRVTAAVSPWIWMLGIIALLGMILSTKFFSPILLIILIFAAPRIWQTLRAGGRSGPYYQISRRASVWIATVYVGLGLILGLFYFLTHAYLTLG